MSALALLGGEKAKGKPFPIWPHYDEAEERALKQLLESRIWWRTPGTKTLEFEQALARFHGARHGIAVTNGKKLALIEDSSHAHASEWKGKRIGTFGVAGTFSFQSSKLMTAGEGGRIISNDEKFERQARSVHDCRRMPGEWFYSHFIYGSNYRLSEWQGAVLQAQLGRLDEQTKVRHRNARLLDRLRGTIPGITLQKLNDRCTRKGQYAYVNKKEFAEAALPGDSESGLGDHLDSTASLAGG